MSCVDILIAGAGLSGLTAAFSLVKELAAGPAPPAGVPPLRIVVLERSNRLGGRAWDGGGTGIDLGGAWLWPGSSTMFQLCRALQLKTVDQAGGFGEKRVHGGVSKLIGALETYLSSNFAPGKNLHVEIEIQLEKAVSAVSQKSADEPDGMAHALVVSVKDESADAAGVSTELHSRYLVLTLPPKKIATEISFPDETVVGSSVKKNEVTKYLTPSLLARMRDQPIWMAPMGKLALFYEEQFWDPIALNGGMPFRGAMGAAQVYDGGKTTDGKNLHALVFFTICDIRQASGEDAESHAWWQGGGDSKGGQTQVESTAANEQTEKLVRIVLQQVHRFARSMNALKGASGAGGTVFSRMFCVHGSSVAENPFEEKLHSYAMKCWKTDNAINTAAAAERFPQHPNPISGLNDDYVVTVVEGEGKRAKILNRRRVFLAGTEASRDFTGMLEGAARSGVQAARKIIEAMGAERE
eukprot:CAMPEP_0171105880 /NCGR_PEP_ID=MMETSP0766_2-20121228/63632_1 /TAXON_ID=439317 /ORGANISM="Gambierdiscus australes, Strain CAWD 149" /LENGTH=467 /DNA_ID=CAMNT_0011566839 /DNA_START=33 /DNA_END=1436 /DNA_ORIENTATION=-